MPSGSAIAVEEGEAALTENECECDVLIRASFDEDERREKDDEEVV